MRVLFALAVAFAVSAATTAWPVQLLVIDRNTVTGDAATDDARYQRGYVVQVFHDSKVLTRPMPEPFVVIKINGLNVEDAEKYLLPELNPSGERVLRRRLYGISWDSLPSGVKAALQKDRYYETTWTVVKDYVKNLRTGANE